MDGGAAIKKYDTAHDNQGPGEFLNGIRRYLSEKARIQGEGQHHHINSNKGRYTQTNELFTEDAGCGISIRRHAVISEFINNIDYLVRRGLYRIIVQLNLVRSKTAGCI